MAKSKQKKIRYGVVGLGWISQAAVLPAFEHASGNSELVALVSSDRKKLKDLGKKYGVEALYGPEDYEAFLRNENLDAVYIALPNSQHVSYSIAAARAGKHVLCEKPMALTVRECEQMISACEEEKVKLMIAYRLHFDKANLEAIQIAHSGKLGDLRFFSSTFSMTIKDRNNIRMQQKLGGGPLLDLGIYCINAARYLFQSEPLEVTGLVATGNKDKFREVEETFSGLLRFSRGRLAQFTCSFGAADTSVYEIVGTKGKLHVEPAYETTDPLAHCLTIGESETEKEFEKSDQFAPELVYFSDCILKNKTPEPSGYEGLNDVTIMEALYRSVDEKRTVPVNILSRIQRPSVKQAMKLPPVRKKPLVHVSPPAAA